MIAGPLPLTAIAPASVTGMQSGWFRTLRKVKKAAKLQLLHLQKVVPPQTNSLATLGEKGFVRIDR
jgi:hypothetical protein